MHDLPVGNIIREVKLLGPSDTIGQAAEAMRVSGLTSLPVVNSGRVVGMIDESSVLKVLSVEDPV